MVARVLMSAVVGAIVYLTVVVFEALRFWLGINQPRAINDEVMHKILFVQIPKAPLAFAIGISCALTTFAVLFAWSFHLSRR